jgi:hypothetical protein
MIVTKQDNDMSMPNKCVRFMLDTKRGVMEVTRYNRNAIKVRALGDFSI